MSNAKTFIDQIKNGDVTDAISTIKESLTLKLDESKEHIQLDVLQSFGFAEKFEKEESKEEPEDKEDDSDEAKKDDKEGSKEDKETEDEGE